MQRHRNQSNGFRSNGPVYRNYNNRGGGGGGGGGYRGPPPPRRIDVFMEAGRLATQYLLAKGLLNNNNNIKGQNNNSTINDVKSPVVAVSDLRDESKVVRRNVKDPRIELSNNNEVSKNLEKIGEGEGEGDGAGLGGEEVKLVVSGDLELRNVETKVANEEKELRDENVPVLEVTKMEGVESEEKSDDVKNVDVKTEEDVMMDDGDEKDEKTVVEEDVMEENENENENENGNGNGNGKDSGSDLLTLIRDDNVPTRTRSSLTLKGSKSDPVLISGDENRMKEQNLEEAEREPKPEPEQGLEMKHEPKVTKLTSDEDDMYKFGLGLHMRSQSFPQRSVSELGLGDGHQEFSRSSSDVLGRGEKRPLEINDFTDISKKPRDWASASPPPHNYFNLSSSRGDQSSSHEGGSFAEEKQLFPNSFKICDLNLMGGSEANENRDTKSAIGSLPIGQAKQEPVSVDFDLTMNNSCGIGDRNVRRGIDGKGVEVIDLDCDSVQDGNNNSDRRDEAIFTDLESFPDNMQRVSDLPQDGYGLMISELLDADIPNSSVSTGVNAMHNEMSLQNEEGILGDDDSIYMSLGEIPISFVPVWDQQPSQRYDKRY
ncbi:hypothetical protein CTI12_AA069590 [Artemisia annua]|uniref:Uncharacterized protein n=1 Tax=Artemisia annua TaxID=35608 RepID=A0A2U1P2R0_ARTAN|nr:hypothetical protein CTI12_AA069590 [Artemisia annua]